MGIRRRLDRLEAQAPTALGEDEAKAEACSRMSTEDLVTLSDLGWRLERRLKEQREGESLEEAIRDALTEEERDAFEDAYGRYQEAVKEVRAGR